MRFDITLYLLLILQASNETHRGQVISLAHPGRRHVMADGVIDARFTMVQFTVSFMRHLFIHTQSHWSY